MIEIIKHGVPKTDIVYRFKCGDGTTIFVFEHGVTIEVVSTIYDNTD